MTTSLDLNAKQVVAVRAEYNFSLPYCNCTEPDIFSGQQYCFRMDALTGTIDTQCHFCTVVNPTKDDNCQRSGTLNPAHPSLYGFCTEELQLPAGLQVNGFWTSRLWGMFTPVFIASA